MKFLLVASTDSQTTLRAVMGLSTASISRGHEVSVFFNEDSVRLLRDGRDEGGLKSPFPKGTSLLACRTSARERGVGEADLPEGARMSSLAELVDLLEECDRAVFLG